MTLGFKAPKPFSNTAHLNPKPKALLWTQDEYLQVYALVESVMVINPEYRILEFQLPSIVAALFREARCVDFPGAMLPDAHAVCTALDHAKTNAKAVAREPYWDDLNNICA